jgi:hypothetical protein
LHVLLAPGASQLFTSVGGSPTVAPASQSRLVLNSLYVSLYVCMWYPEFLELWALIIKCSDETQCRWRKRMPFYFLLEYIMIGYHLHYYCVTQPLTLHLIKVGCMHKLDATHQQTDRQSVSYIHWAEQGPASGVKYTYFPNFIGSCRIQSVQRM